MNAKKPSAFSRIDLARFDLMPSIGKLFQPMEGQGGPFPIKQSLSLEAGERRGAFHLRSPPTPRGRSLHSPATAAIASYCSATSSGTHRRSIANFTHPFRRSRRAAATRRRSGTRRRRGENGRWRDGPGRPQDAVSNQPSQSSAFLAAGDRAHRLARSGRQRSTIKPPRRP